MSLQLPLSDIARAVDGSYQGSDVGVTGVSTDTRALRRGDLFVALRGPRHDGHSFLREAREKGAAAALVSAQVETDLPLVCVDDCRKALAALAASWRGRFAIPLIGVTGSNGKTTVKEMTAAILRRRGPVLATEGNKNNDIGMPLTLLRLGPEHRYAVIEMGANHEGEIAALCAAARPTVAVVTNAAAAHLEGFRSLDGVARAKGELFAGLQSTGTAVINADDPYYSFWRDLAGRRVCISFGIEHGADVTATDLRRTGGGVTFELHAGGKTRTAALKLAGLHNVRNALAAAAASLAAGATLDDVRCGLELVSPVHGRMCLQVGLYGVRLIDDTYNANPSSLEAALEALAAAPGERVVVLGDMYELGEAAGALHQQAGRRIKSAGVSRLYAVGDQCRHAVTAFGEGGRHFADRAALIKALAADLGAMAPGATVLVKGSRGMAMEAVVDALKADTRDTGGGGAPPPDVKHGAAVAPSQG